jgi:hypothetical protein
MGGHHACPAKPRQSPAAASLKKAAVYNRRGGRHTLKWIEMDFLKTVTGKVVSGLVALAVIVCAVSWYRMDEQTKQGLISGTGKIFSWLGVVLIVPWLAFALIGRVAKLQSNVAGAVLVVALTGLELAMLGWMFNWSIGGRTAWTFLLLGGLVAAIYNLLTCDWIAEKLE